MDTLAKQIPGVLENFGRAFLLAAFLPALLFLAAQELFILPGAPTPLIPPAVPAVATTAPPAQPSRPTISAAPTATPTSEAQAAAAGMVQGEVPAASSWVQLIRDALTALVLPMLVGVLLLALNTSVIRFFEGSHGWQRVLLGPVLRRNQKRARTLYRDLVKTKEEYTRQLSRVDPGGPPDPQTLQKLASLALQMQEELNKIDMKAPVQSLPRREQAVMPTALGNAFAVMEEYSYERYGMDAMIFWPRLRPLVEEAAGAQLTNYKIVLDMLLNIALLAGVFGIECWVLAAVHVAWLPVIAGVVAVGMAYAAYAGGVQTAWALKEVAAGCFDFNRHLVLEKFGLKAPDDLEGEQLVWLRLGQFLRRGEGFYFPGWARSTASAASLGTPSS
jgi:hypothetical protein